MSEMGFEQGSRLLIGLEKLRRLTQTEHLMKERVETNRSVEARLSRSDPETF